MNTRIRPSSARCLAITCLVTALLGGAVAPCSFAAPIRRPAWTVADLYASPAPYALGHRGYGANPGTDPTRPLENTLEAFQQAFHDGIRVVELDLQRTADGSVVVFHDDALPNGSCVGGLTYDQLLAVRPEVPLFRAVLHSCRHFRNSDRLSGVVIAEIKVPVPLCDGASTSELAAASESELVAAVVAEIRRAGMEGQVVLNAGSPSILRQAALQAPEIPRALSLNVLQLVDPLQVAALTGLPVTKIAKNDCGLDWYEVGGIARLPSFYATSGPSPFQRFAATTLGCAAASAVSLDKSVLFLAGAAAPAMVAGLHAAGLEVIVWTIENEAEWNAVAALGVDGLTTNDIALGLRRQAPLPEVPAADVGAGGAAGAPSGVSTAHVPALALAPANPSRDGVLRFAVSLPEGGPARLEIVDVAGRLVASRDVGQYGLGRHELSLGERFAPGVYLARLRQAGNLALAKVTVVR